MATEVGAAGFVTKSDLSRDLLSTIDRVTQRLIPRLATRIHAGCRAGARWARSCAPRIGAIRFLGPREIGPGVCRSRLGLCQFEVRPDLVVGLGPGDPGGTVIAIEIPLIEVRKAFVASVRSEAASPGVTQH